MHYFLFIFRSLDKHCTQPSKVTVVPTLQQGGYARSNKVSSELVTINFLALFKSRISNINPGNLVIMQ